MFLLLLLPLELEGGLKETSAMILRRNGLIDRKEEMVGEEKFLSDPETWAKLTSSGEALRSGLFASRSNIEAVIASAACTSGRLLTCWIRTGTRTKEIRQKSRTIRHMTQVEKRC